MDLNLFNNIDHQHQAFWLNIVVGSVGCDSEASFFLLLPNISNAAYQICGTGADDLTLSACWIAVIKFKSAV